MVNTPIFSAYDARSLASVVLAFGQVQRITRDAHGNRESDTTHTVMLALFAGMAAHKLLLNESRAVWFALVHDLCEVYAGDTPTLIPLNAGSQAAKDQREAEALARLRVDLAGFPEIIKGIEAYERQDSVEARLVKVLDKAMPRLTHLLNGCATVREHGMNRTGLEARIESQNAHLRETLPEIPEITDFLQEIGRVAIELMPEDHVETVKGPDNA